MLAPSGVSRGRRFWTTVRPVLTYAVAGPFLGGAIFAASYLLIAVLVRDVQIAVHGVALSFGMAYVLGIVPATVAGLVMVGLRSLLPEGWARAGATCLAALLGAMSGAAAFLAYSGSGMPMPPLVSLLKPYAIVSTGLAVPSLIAAFCCEALVLRWQKSVRTLPAPQAPTAR